ncbi:MAG: SAM-dependent methyltransferase [Paludibacteraceae bacterium]|nr:SAM-dependent methyltransferase [Paludibacteraceae bacterium]
MLTLTPIAFARNGFTDKFGIPRQVREHTALRTRIVFCPPYRSDDAIRGIEEFSHLWLLWGFHQTSEVRGQKSAVSDQQLDIKHQTSDIKHHLTVRPPRLGGNTRVGVFATRSPYRPNPLGLTSVRLVAVEHTAEGAVLVVEGADMMDGTPIYDIKPYLGYCDSHPDARDGFVDTTPRRLLTVVWPTDNCQLSTVNCQLPKAELQEILEQDPRPAYHSDPDRIYGIDYAGWNLHFRVTDDTLYVLEVKRL